MKARMCIVLFVLGMVVKTVEAGEMLASEKLGWKLGFRATASTVLPSSRPSTRPNPSSCGTWKRTPARRSAPTSPA